jgi:FKBP-type peptidyl-prolyl cis-trans isomerase FkpA
MSVTAVPLRPIKKGSLTEAVARPRAFSCLARPPARLGRHRGPADGLTTASGLQIQVLKEGTGASPTTTDIVLEYEGRLEDGTVFDDSEGQAARLRFPSPASSRASPKACS